MIYCCLIQEGNGITMIRRTYVDIDGLNGTLAKDRDYLDRDKPEGELTSSLGKFLTMKKRGERMKLYRGQ